MSDVIEGERTEQPEGSTRSADGDEASDGARFSVREVVLFAVAVLGVAGTILFYTRWSDLEDEAGRVDDVEETATAFTQALFEFDGNTINEDFDEILSFATGDFAIEADETFNDADTRTQLAENRVASRAEAVDVFVQSVEGDRARVFAVVDQRVANGSFPEPVADEVRLSIGLQEEDGEWKVFDVDVLGGLAQAVPEVNPAG